LICWPELASFSVLLIFFYQSYDNARLQTGSSKMWAGFNERIAD